MGKVILSGVSKGMTAPVSYKANFADNTWEQIIDACQKNKVPDTWLVADQKAMTINGTDYLIDIIGKNHDTYSDGSGTAPLTFQLHDCYGTKYAMHTANTNNVGWSNCAMRTTHLPSIFALMPSDVRSGIKSVKKLTSAGNNSSTITTTSDSLFLLSEIEVFGTITRSYTGEGKQYEYYKAGNSKDKNFNGSAYYWAERSPTNNAKNTYCWVVPGGTVGTDGATGTKGVSFAFCF